MKEFVLVEFLFKVDENEQGLGFIRGLGDDFIPLTSEFDFESIDPRGYTTAAYNRISGKINSQAATAIKLSNKFLSDRMRISYISDELKDKYRK